MITVQPWPVSGPISPALLRYLLSTSFGQFEDVLQRAGVPLTPDYSPPTGTGAGDRSWLSAATLLDLVGDDWDWQESRQNEVSCQVTFNLENEHAHSDESSRRIDSIPLSLAFYVRYVGEEDSAPCLAIRAHTQGGLAQGKLDRVVTHHLNEPYTHVMGEYIPVSIDQDGDLSTRQIVLCPEKPHPELVQHLIGTALRSLGFAAHEIVF